MRLETILNNCSKFKSFIFKSSWFEENRLIVKVESRKNGLVYCSGCGMRCNGYDTLSKRRFQFVPMWGYHVFFEYKIRRVSCEHCGVKVERLPWSDGKGTLTKAYQSFLAMWAKKLSWQEVAIAFKSSWYHVYESVKSHVNYGLAHRTLDDIEAIGVDEWQHKKGQNYLTLVYQLDKDNRRLLFATEKRTVKSLLKFFRMLGKGKSAKIKYVCTDMWKPYLKVIKKKCRKPYISLTAFMWLRC